MARHQRTGECQTADTESSAVRYLTSKFPRFRDDEFMVEILWKSEAPHVPVQDHEFCELRLVDLGNASFPRFLVREIHGAWSAAAQQIRWNGYQDETCRTPEDAQRRFESRRASNLDSGFAYRTRLE